ncbi:recombinase family protein [Nocardia sp. CA-084685]|uniref:recombinase family protein n=1 Tax=Nocardia sp. CA-084685 TaxID=3239970 RepID=UPI003D96597B
MPTGPDTQPYSIFNILATFAAFEVDLLRMRTREGMAVARAKGASAAVNPSSQPSSARNCGVCTPWRVHHRRRRRTVRPLSAHHLPQPSTWARHTTQVIPPPTAVVPQPTDTQGQDSLDGSAGSARSRSRALLRPADHMATRTPATVLGEDGKAALIKPKALSC